MPAPVRLSAAQIEDVARLLLMEDARALDTVLVARVLESSEPELRGRAALAAGRVRDRAATPFLLAALQDDDVRVRARAAFALGKLADSADHVVAALSAVATGTAPLAAVEAVAALGQLGVPAGRDAVEALLATPQSPRAASPVTAAVREAALLAAWRLPRTESTTAAVQRWVGHPDPETRWRAAYALGRIGGEATVRTLLGALDDPDDRVRASALRGLRAAVVDSANARAEAFPALLTAAADPHPHVRINALRLLPAYRRADSSTPVLMGLLRDADRNVAVAAAQTLAEAADTAAAPALRAAAMDVRGPDGLRAAALASWMRLDAAGALPVAAAWADSSRWLLRFHAARSLAAAPWQESGTLLQLLARDPHYLVSAEALGAIRTAADTTDAARRVYIEQLGAGHPLVRAAAARGLERLASPADLDLLLAAYAHARLDSVRDAAMAVLDALGAVARAGAPVENTFFARFGHYGAPADAALHRAIIRRIGTPPSSWSPPASGPQLRDLGFHLDIVRRLVAPALVGEPLPRVAITTAHGDIVLELAAADAPLTVHNFLTLVERAYYSGTRWHRVVPNFVIQDGDPRGDGSGNPGYSIRDEINTLRYARGVLGMALSGPDTGGGQFFITHSPQPHLDGGYTVFGRVFSGMDAVDSVVQDEPIMGFRRVQ
ncbi:hypothetical protein BH23GEM9_BH23GEM9_30710 [soil metagenome]